jgi:hypothetical protein
MNLIYQYWDGDIPPGAIISRKLMESYADKIGADYLFEHNTRWVTGYGRASHFYGHFKLVHDPAFDKYDNILFVDSDIYPVDGLSDNIFKDIKGDIGLCEETWQPQNRLKMNGHHISNIWDEKWCKAIHKKWKVTMPRTDEGLPKVFNAGLILYARSGIDKLRQSLVPVEKYIAYMKQEGLKSFYLDDQNYLHAMIFVCELDLCELSTDWNSLIHGYFRDGIKKRNRAVNDLRTPAAKFVHIQLSEADDFAEDVLYRITNQPAKEWAIPTLGYMEKWGITRTS